MKNNEPSSTKIIAALMLSSSVFSVFFIILFSSLSSYAFNTGYYDKEYSKYHVYDRFPRETAMNETQNILGFFSSKNDLHASFFSGDEISHLSDVKGLLDGARAIYVYGLVLFWAILAYYAFFQKKSFMHFLSKLMLISGIFSIVVLAALAMIYFTAGFDLVFTRFHELFFAGNYAFDPAVSNMKALFPDGFFSDMAVSVYIMTLIKASLLSVSGYYLIKKTRN